MGIDFLTHPSEQPPTSAARPPYGCLPRLRPPSPMGVPGRPTALPPPAALASPRHADAAGAHGAPPPLPYLRYLPSSSSSITSARIAPWVPSQASHVTTAAGGVAPHAGGVGKALPGGGDEISPRGIMDAPHPFPLPAGEEEERSEASDMVAWRAAGAYAYGGHHGQQQHRHQAPAGGPSAAMYGPPVDHHHPHHPSMVTAGAAGSQTHGLGVARLGGGNHGGPGGLSVLPRPFSCNKCGKKLRKKEHLKRHVQLIHERRRPYGCKVCAVAFGTKQNLQTHLMTKVHSRRAAAVEEQAGGGGGGMLRLGGVGAGSHLLGGLDVRGGAPGLGMAPMGAMLGGGAAGGGGYNLNAMGGSLPDALVGDMGPRPPMYAGGAAGVPHRPMARFMSGGPAAMGGSMAPAGMVGGLRAPPQQPLPYRSDPMALRR